MRSKGEKQPKYRIQWSKKLQHDFTTTLPYERQPKQTQEQVSLNDSVENFYDVKSFLAKSQDKVQIEGTKKEKYHKRQNH